MTYIPGSKGNNGPRRRPPTPERGTELTLKEARSMAAHFGYSLEEALAILRALSARKHRDPVHIAYRRNRLAWAKKKAGPPRGGSA